MPCAAMFAPTAPVMVSITLLERAEPADGKRRIEMEAEPLVHIAVPEAGQVQRGFAQALGRHPRVDRGRAARSRLAVHDRDALAEVRAAHFEQPQLGSAGVVPTDGRLD